MPPRSEPLNRDVVDALEKTYPKCLNQIRRDYFGRYKYRYGMSAEDLLHLAIERMLRGAKWSKVLNLLGYIEFAIMRNAKQIYLNNKRLELSGYSKQEEVEANFYPSSEIFSQMRVDVRFHMEKMDPTDLGVLVERAEGTSTSNICLKMGISRRRLYDSLSYLKSNTSQEFQP